MPVLFSAAISYYLVSVSAFPYISSVNKRIQATQRSLELKPKTGSLRDDLARDGAATKGTLQLRQWQAFAAYVRSEQEFMA
jgi:hypothetical protein